ADFLRGVEALQVLQDKSLAVFGVEERSERLGGPVPAGAVTPRDVLEAAKNGHEYRPEPGGATWVLVKKTSQPVLHIHPNAWAAPEMQEFARTFRLKPGQSKYDVEVEKLIP